MELALFVYVAGVIGQISTLLGSIVGVAMVVGGGTMLITLASTPIISDSGMVKAETRDKILGLVKKVLLFVCIPVALLGSCTQAVLPSEKTLYLMGGAYVTQAVVQSETADKVLKIVNGKLDEYLQDVEESVKEGVKK